MQSYLAVLFRLIVLCITLVELAPLAGCKARADNSSSPPPPEVGVGRVQKKEVSLWEEFNGRVSATETVEVRARVSGYVNKVTFREGGEVKKGDLLFVVDQRPYLAALESAEAQLGRARATADLAKSQAERAQVLISSKAISKEELEARLSDVAKADADVAAARAAVSAAKLNLGFTEVRAPIGGRISRAALTVGNLVQADQTLLTTIVSQDPVFVYFDCDEKTFLRSRSAGSGRAETRGVATARVALADEHDFPRSGAVDFLDNQVNSATGTIRARVLLKNDDRALTPGLYARVKFESTGAAQALLIDDRAVLTDQDRKYVYVVGSENKALRKDITAGRLIDGLRVVESGLDPSDKIVVSGQMKIFFPGMPVQPVESANGQADGHVQSPVAMK